MAAVTTEQVGVGNPLEVAIGDQDQQYLSGESLAEWRSSEQLENAVPSTSPPYWDSDDEDDEGLKPSELYGKYTWKIDKFSQINKRELRSNAFEVGGYKWYILIYPQGCDVCNHLSLFLCVGNHDKLLPGWSHFAQFTIAVVNKDPKKSKYSDTLHRFWKKEHDWGWKKFMELSKVFDGFIDADTLIIKAQVQVIRERADRPFRCLDCQYRRELIRVYLSNVEQICRRFWEERQSILGKLIEDKARWSIFCAFWLSIDQSSRRHMSQEKTESILKVVVKQFFIEKEVTSTLVMDSLYSGLRALEAPLKGKSAKGKYLDAEESSVPIIRVEKDMFVLVGDVLSLLQRAAVEPLPPKDEKGPQNRMKDGSAGEEFNRDSIERVERRLTELGRRTIEIFILAHIFSKIEVAYQEAVALKKQEELIREEEAAWLVENEHKLRRGSLDKEKKSKKKQKQKRNNRKGKEKGRDEKICSIIQAEMDQDSFIDDKTEDSFTAPGEDAARKKSSAAEDVSDVSDSAPERPPPDSEYRDASPVNWDTDTSEAQPLTEASSSGISGLSSLRNGKSSSVLDDTASTSSSDSVPSSAAFTGPLHKSYSSRNRDKKTPSWRGRNHQSKQINDQNSRPSETMKTVGYPKDGAKTSKGIDFFPPSTTHSWQNTIGDRAEASEASGSSLRASSSSVASQKSVPKADASNGILSGKASSSSHGSSSSTRSSKSVGIPDTTSKLKSSQKSAPPKAGDNKPVGAPTLSRPNGGGGGPLIPSSRAPTRPPGCSVPESPSQPHGTLSYRNAMMGRSSRDPSPAVTYVNPTEPSPPFGMNPPVVVWNSAGETPGGRQQSSYASADELFPHLDIINDLLDDENGGSSSSSVHYNSKFSQQQFPPPPSTTTGGLCRFEDMFLPYGCYSSEAAVPPVHHPVSVPYGHGQREMERGGGGAFGDEQYHVYGLMEYGFSVYGPSNGL